MLTAPQPRFCSNDAQTLLVIVVEVAAVIVVIAV